MVLATIFACPVATRVRVRSRLSIGFRSAIAPERDLQIARRKFRQALCRAPEQYVEHRLARKRHQFELRAHCRDDARMRMTQRENAVSASEVQIRLSRRVPNHASARAHFNRRTGNLHHPRQRRIHIVLIVLEDLIRSEFGRRRCAVQVSRPWTQSCYGPGFEQNGLAFRLVRDSTAAPVAQLDRVPP